MSEDIEELLRAELAGRADAAPPSHRDGLADAAIAGAGRIRRRRRAGVVGGGLALVVLGAATAVWLPWSADGPADPPAATTVDEAQDGLDIEFTVERDGSYGVVNADDEYISLTTEQRPSNVERLQSSYVVSSPQWVEVTALDGSESSRYAVPADEFHTEVRSDAEAFAVNYIEPVSGRAQYSLFSGDPEAAGDPAVLDLAAGLVLRDWNDSLLVFSGDLTTVSGGVTGTYYFNDQYDWGLETAAAAGYESVVVTDTAEPDYVCVADLEPGAGAAASEECGYLDIGEDTTEELIVEASGDKAAPGLVSKVSDSFFEEGLETEIVGDEDLRNQLFESEYQFVDPLGRWQIAFSASDETWVLLDLSGEEPVVSELRPPEGALLPVLSYN